MRKLLGSTLALAMLFTSAPAFSAELFKNVTASGQIDLQTTNATNVTDFVTRGNGSDTNNDRIGNAQVRLMVNIGLDLLDDVHGMVTLTKNDRSYGTTGGAGQVNANSQPVGTAGANVLGSVFVDQAYFKIDKLVGDVNATFGRQFYGNAGDLIIYFGPSDAAWFGLPTDAIDGARFDWANDQHSITALVAKRSGTAVTDATNTDIDVRGVEANCKGENHQVRAFLYNKLEHRNGALGSDPTVVASGGFTDGGKNDNLYVIGVGGKVEVGPAWIKALIAKNFGDQRHGVDLSAGEDHSAKKYTGYALLAKGGANLELGGIGKVNPNAVFGYGTGRTDARSNDNQGFQSINSDFRPGVLVGRFMEHNSSVSHLGGASNFGVSPGLENKIVKGVGVDVTPSAAEKLTVGLSLTDFHTQTNAQPTNEGQQAVFGGNTHIGTEAAVQATWKHSDNVTVVGSVATFQPGGLIRAIKNANATDHRNNPAQMAAFDVRVKFGGKGS